MHIYPHGNFLKIWELTKNTVYPIICSPEALERHLLSTTPSAGSASQGRKDAKDMETIWKTTYLLLYGDRAKL